MNKKLREENATELAEKQVRTWNMIVLETPLKYFHFL